MKGQVSLTERVPKLEVVRPVTTGARVTKTFAAAEWIPFAIGVAISPVPIIAVILMLFSRRAKVNGLAFLVESCLLTRTTGHGDTNPTHRVWRDE